MRAISTASRLPSMTVSMVERMACALAWKASDVMAGASSRWISRFDTL